MKQFYFLVITLLSVSLGFGQTLSQGDLAIIGVSVDDENFLLVALDDIPSGESVFFTDEEWNGTTSFNSGEGFYEWVTPSITAGTVITVTTTSTTAGGTVSQITGSFALGNSGDGVYIYQTSTNVYNTGTYTILGFAGEDAGDSGSLTGTGLTLGTNAVYFGGDNGMYNDARTGGDKSFFLGLIYDYTNWVTSGTSQTYDTTNFTIGGGTPDTSVQFVSTSISVSEDSNTYDLEFAITNEDATNATSFDVVLTSGDASDIDSYTTQSVTFPAGDATNKIVTVTITDDIVEEADETLTFEIQNVTGGNNATVGTNNSFDLTILDNDSTDPITGDIIITEIMYNSSSTDDEWIEIYNASGADITLDSDWRLNYHSSMYDFSGTVINAGSYLTIALGSNGDGTFNNDNPFTPDLSTIGTPVATTNDTDNLINSTATIALIFEPSGSNITIDTVTYDDGSPWPTSADGDGPSLELTNTTLDNSLASSWFSASGYDGGTPGLAPNITYTYNGTWSPIDPNGIATTSDAIIIASGDASMASNTTCNTLTVNPGASLTVNSGITLNINDAVNGLTLESTSTSFSSLIVDGTVTGTVNYERFTAGVGPVGTNDLIAAPLSGQNFSDFATANAGVLADNGGTLRAFAPFDKTSGSYTNYDTVTDAAVTLNAGTGYRAATSTGSNLTFSGTVNTATVNVPITNSGPSYEAWNLIGNPFPSYLDVDSFISTNQTQMLAGSVGVYGYDGTASNGWTVYNLASSGAVMTPGQGFFVAATSGGGSVDFTPSMRITGSSDDFIVGRVDNSSNSAHAKLNLNYNSTTYGTDIYFIEGTTQNLDPGYDTSAFNNNAAGIFTALVQNSTNEELAIQSLPYSDLSDVVVPVGIKVNAGIQATISLNDISTVPSSTFVYLEDTTENTWTLLNNNDYTFVSSTDLNGTGRFYIHFSAVVLSNEDFNFENIAIYTPNSNSIVVKGQLTENTTFTLYDIQGRLVLTKELDSNLNTNTIYTPNISKGVYLVKLDNNNFSKTKKIIIR